MEVGKHRIYLGKLILSWPNHNVRVLILTIEVILHSFLLFTFSLHVKENKMS